MYKPKEPEAFLTSIKDDGYTVRLNNTKVLLFAKVVKGVNLKRDLQTQ